MKKDNMWSWPNNAADPKAIDGFLDNLKKANNQSILLPDQMLKVGDVNGSVATLLYMAVSNSNSTGKVVETMLEMDKYLQRHYGKSKEWNGPEKLYIPVALDVLEEKIAKNVSDSKLKFKANLLVSHTKADINQDESADRRNTYDTLYSGFKNYVTESEKTVEKPSKQYVLPAKNVRVI